MAVEVALALVVLMAAALFLRSFSETRDTDPGFRREGVLLAAYDLYGPQPATTRRRATSRPACSTRLRALPGVDAAAIATSVPLDIHGLPMRAFTLEGRARSDAAPDRGAQQHRHARLFRGDGDPAARGAGFRRPATTPRRRRRRSSTRSSCAATSDGASRSDARLRDPRHARYTIAGVVRQLGERLVRREADAGHLPVVSRPAVAGGRDPPAHARRRRDRCSGREVRARRAGARSDAAGLRRPHAVRSRREEPVPAPHSRRGCSSCSGPLLLVLAAIGIYAVVAYAVSLRTTEIGVRLALGATNGRVVSQIVRRVCASSCVGALRRVVAAFGFDRHLLRGPVYLSVFAGVPALLFGVAALACWLPARRASALDPIAALRQE